MAEMIVVMMGLRKHWRRRLPRYAPPWRVLQTMQVMVMMMMMHRCRSAESFSSLIFNMAALTHYGDMPRDAKRYVSVLQRPVMVYLSFLFGWRQGLKKEPEIGCCSFNMCALRCSAALSNLTTALHCSIIGLA
jgi:hypothetical protein